MRSIAPRLEVTIGGVDIVTVIAFVAVAAIQGGLVALPRSLAFRSLSRLRSPAWALLGPGSLLFGTFGVLAVPRLATGLAILAVIATPVLAAIAVVAVVHGGRPVLLLVPLALGAVALAGSGVPAQLAASLLTALGCLTLGAAIARLTPARWLQLGVLSMAAVDVLLLALGIGQPAAALLAHALDGVGPTFHRAQVGTMSQDYPDLVLAAVVGGVVAGRSIQPRVALLVAVLAIANGGLLVFASVVPATVGPMLALAIVEWMPRLRIRAPRVGDVQPSPAPV
jgi:hypothetical protein